MARPFRVEIHESLEDLAEQLRQSRNVYERERLQLLYWIKQDPQRIRGELAQLLGCNESTVTRWLNRYRQGGLADLLERRLAPGKPAKVPPEVVAALKQRLKKRRSGFGSYGDIHTWMKEQGVEVAYPTVHKLVRYKLKSKLKVPRPKSIKQDLGAIERFQKTPASPQSFP